MGYKIGIDVGGTFTDFFVTHPEQPPQVHKVLSSPDDPSVAFVQGLSEIAASLQPAMTVNELMRQVDTIVHGTTVTTNATLTHRGARTGLLTTKGLRDALEMRRGIREEQYNNHYTNVEPLVPRHRRIGITGRVDAQGEEVEPLNLAEVREAMRQFRADGVESIAVCFMNAFANRSHEKSAAEVLREEMPEGFLTVSTELLPSIRFYDRVSTTVLNSYVGPILNRYLERLLSRLQEVGFGGVLLIMQSNGGMMTPGLARRQSARTLLSGPAAGPYAGREYARTHGRNDCLTIDMGGTSFDAALVLDSPVMVTEGEINRHRIALPMLGIHTIGSGGGSVGWLDEGGLLRMGPHSAGAEPGPACYGKGGTEPTCTDANLVLGYLHPDYFAGGRMPLDLEAARAAIRQRVAEPMGLSVEEAAAGMFRIISTNMAQGVREITIKRGFDPREFPMVVAGGAGPLHACTIGAELEIPLLIVPRESSIFCAAGMLLCDLKHDFVRTFVARLDEVDWEQLNRMVGEMVADGEEMLQQEHIPPHKRQHYLKLDCRYVKQYHEVSFEVPLDRLRDHDAEAVARAFHAVHNRMYGYELSAQGAPIEVINVRVQSVGVTDKPALAQEAYAGADPSAAAKETRRIYVPDTQEFREVSVFDGHKVRFGNRFSGPAVIEQVNTTLLVTAGFDCVCDAHGSYAVYAKGREDLVEPTLKGEATA